MMKGEKTCQALEEDLVLYYYGDCSAADRERVEAHLEGCADCTRFLADLRRLLPLTVKPDEPPPVFWDEYSREIRRRLAAGEERRSWWKGLASLPRFWPVPALAMALVLIVALTLTYTKGGWRQPGEEAILKVLPVVEELEFFETMELLNAMDLLEAIEGTGSERGV